MQYINPFKLFCGAIIPNWLLRRQEISPGAKLCYARLCQYAHRETGEAFPRQNVIATELGCHDRQLRNYIAELAQYNLIEVVQLGKKQSNRYKFLEHEWMELRQNSDRQDIATRRKSDRQLIATPMERQYIATPYEEIQEENHTKEKIYKKETLDNFYESQLEAQTIAPNTSKLPTQQKENTLHQVAKKVAVASIPEWIPKEEWAAFLEMRQKIKKPMTERAKGLVIGKLAKLKEQGEDVVAVLEQSIMNSYQGLFPVQKPKGGNNGRDSKGGELSGIMQSFKNEFGTFNSFG